MECRTEVTANEIFKSEVEIMLAQDNHEMEDYTIVKVSKHFRGRLVESVER